MPVYSCQIIYGGKPVHERETTAPSAAKACSNTWWKYAEHKGVSKVRYRIWRAQMKDMIYTCRCNEITPEQPPQPEPEQEPDREQGNLFGERLDRALGI